MVVIDPLAHYPEITDTELLSWLQNEKKMPKRKPTTGLLDPLEGETLDDTLMHEDIIQQFESLWDI